MKKIVLIIISFFLFIPLVSAESGIIYGDRDINIKYPPYARFYDLSSPTTAVDISTGAFNYYYNTRTALPVNNSSGYGGLICFDTDTIFVPGYTYSVAFYLGVTNIDYVFQNVGVLPGQLRKAATGTTLSGTMTSYTTGATANIIGNYATAGALRLSFTNYANSPTFYSGVRYVVFTPTVQGSTFCADFTTINTYSYFALFGYNVYSLGLNSSQLTKDITKNINDALGDLGDVATSSDITKAVNDINSKLAATEKAITEEQKKTNEKLDKIDDTLNNSDVSDAQGSANDFFDNFDDNDYGLSEIVSMPLQFINKISSAQCSPIVVPLPFVDTNLTLPCMYDIYQKYFGSMLTIYQTITFGMIAYFICLDIFRMVKNFRDPDKDNIEVMEL